MADPYLAEIRIFAGNFAPSGWALCNGATLAISQNTALFALLGTTYGGNGVSTFQLPNLQGRTVLGFGQLTGGGSYTQGQVGGTENTTLLASNLPAHAHSFAQNISNATGTQSDPTSAVPAQTNIGTPKSPAYLNQYATSAPTGTFPAQNTGITGSGTSFNNLSPYLVVNYIIALAGIFPSRS